MSDRNIISDLDAAVCIQVALPVNADIIADDKPFRITNFNPSSDKHIVPAPQSQPV